SSWASSIYGRRACLIGTCRKRARRPVDERQGAVTDLEQLKGHPALAKLLEWNSSAVTSARFDRNELTVDIDHSYIRQACSILKPTFNFFSDLTCVDWFPSEPRFHVKYHLLSLTLKDRVRLNVKLAGDDPAVESIVSV